MKRLVTFLGSVSMFGLALTSPAKADDAIVVTSTTPTTETATTGPNTSLLRSGLFTLGVSYIPALVVAIESDAEADKHLYAPVVGPWLNLANREDCEGCDSDTLNRVLLVTDGIFQGIGALQILGAFVFPETRAVTVSGADGSTQLSLRVAPATFAGGRGLVATGEF